jgi:DNA-directed RNA polymerase specialized sigma24 family protein
MSKARSVITALFVEGQTPSEVAQRYGVHRASVTQLVQAEHHCPARLSRPGARCRDCSRSVSPGRRLRR